MRVLLKSSEDSKLVLLSVDRAYISDCVIVNDGAERRYYKYPSVLTFTVPESAKTAHIVMPEEQCTCQLNTLLVQGYIDLTNYAENTFIFLDERCDEKLLNAASEVHYEYIE